VVVRGRHVHREVLVIHDVPVDVDIVERDYQRFVSRPEAAFEVF